MNTPVTPLSLSEALDVVHELACLNGIEPAEAAGDAGLEALARWQARAVDVVADLLFEHHGLLDVLPRSALHATDPGSGDVPDFACAAERELDPEVPSYAVRIVLDLALDGALEPIECRGDPALLAGARRQRQAIGAVRALAALDGDALDEAVSGRSNEVARSGSAAPRTRPLALISRDPVHPEVIMISFKAPSLPGARQ